MDFESFPVVLAVAAALGCDAFSVGIVLGTRMLNSRAAFRLWFHFGLFQFLMPILGWFMGRNVHQYIKSWDHWAAFAFLSIIALKMLYESLKKEKEDSAQEDSFDPTRGLSLVALSLATSLDALGVGFSMGILQTRVLCPAICIGVTAGIMTFVGIQLGERLSRAFGRRVETAGALVLLIIAIKLLEI